MSQNHLADGDMWAGLCGDRSWGWVGKARQAPCLQSSGITCGRSYIAKSRRIRRGKTAGEMKKKKRLDVRGNVWMCV